MRPDAAIHRAAPVLALLVGVALGAAAQEPAVFPTEVDLPQCAVLARLHNPALRRAEERVVEQHAATRETRSAGRPRLDATGTYGVEDSSRVGSFGGGPQQGDTSWSAGLEAGMSLFSGGRLTAQLRAEQAQEASLGADLAASENDLLLQVASRYYRALLAQKRIVVQEEALRLYEMQLDRARKQFESGVGPKFDVLQAEVVLANARPPLVRARNDYRVAIEELRQSVGLPYGPGQTAASVVLRGDWPDISAAEPADQAVAEALQQRPELASLREQLRAAEALVVRARRERAPGLQGYANYLFLNDRFSEDENEVLQGWGVGVRASMPIWEGGAIGSRVAQSESRRIQLDLQREEAEMAVEVEVRAAWFDVEEAEEILQTADLVIEQAGEALRLAENRYRAGGITQLDVLQAQLELTRARLERALAAHDYHVARARLLRAQGRSPIPGA